MSKLQVRFTDSPDDMPRDGEALARLIESAAIDE
jgi:hypothetical protein